MRLLLCLIAEDLCACVRYVCYGHGCRAVITTGVNEPIILLVRVFSIYLLKLILDFQCLRAELLGTFEELTIHVEADLLLVWVATSGSHLLGLECIHCVLILEHVETEVSRP